MEDKVSLNQLWLNYYDNAAPNYAEIADSNSNNPQKVLKEEMKSQNNSYKDKEEFLQ
jgi:hypothetical protein